MNARDVTRYRLELGKQIKALQRQTATDDSPAMDTYRAGRIDGYHFALALLRQMDSRRTAAEVLADREAAVEVLEPS